MGIYEEILPPEKTLSFPVRESKTQDFFDSEFLKKAAENNKAREKICEELKKYPKKSKSKLLLKTAGLVGIIGATYVPEIREHILTHIHDEAHNFLSFFTTTMAFGYEFLKGDINKQLRRRRLEIYKRVLEEKIKNNYPVVLDTEAVKVECLAEPPKLYKS